MLGVAGWKFEPERGFALAALLRVRRRTSSRSGRTAEAAIPSECKQVLRIEFSIPSFVGGPSDGPWSRVDTLHFELKTFS